MGCDGLPRSAGHQLQLPVRQPTRCLEGADQPRAAASGVQQPGGEAGLGHVSDTEATSTDAAGHVSLYTLCTPSPPCLAAPGRAPSPPPGPACLRWPCWTLAAMWACVVGSRPGRRARGSCWMPPTWRRAASWWARLASWRASRWVSNRASARSLRLRANGSTASDGRHRVG